MKPREINRKKSWGGVCKNLEDVPALNDDSTVARRFDVRAAVAKIATLIAILEVPAVACRALTAVAAALGESTWDTLSWRRRLLRSVDALVPTGMDVTSCSKIGRAHV